MRKRRALAISTYSSVSKPNSTLLWQCLRTAGQGNGLRAQLLRGGVGSVGLKFVGIGLSLGLAVALARNLGVEGYGVYTYVFTLISLLALPAQSGLPTVVVRETAQAEADQQWGVIRGVWLWAGTSAVLLSLVVALASGCIVWLFAPHFTTLQLTTFGWGLLFIPLLALGSLRGAALRGLRRVVQGQLPEQIIQPALLLGFVLVFAVLGTDNILPNQAMALHVLAAGIAFLVGGWMLARQRPQQLRSKPKPVYRTGPWLKAVVPLALTTGANTLDKRADIILLGILGTPQDVGLFQVAVKGAALVLLAQMAIRQMATPYFARFYKQADFQKLQRLAVVSGRAAAAMALPIVILFVLFGRDLLGALFGAEYISAFRALLILSAAQLLWAATGTLGALLNMTGHEKDSLKIGVMGTVCNIVLNIVMIPLWGLEGAAIATSTTIVLKRVAYWVAVRKRLGVDGSILGLPLKPNGKRAAS